MRALAELADAIACCRFSYATEDELQRALADALARTGRTVEREVRLDGHNRIDLLVDRIGIEVKVAGKADAVMRQIRRYVASDLVDGLLLVTTRARHALPAEVDGKPVAVVQLSGAAL